MLSFFRKKTYLTDLLEGFTDIHCHLLAGIDDGASSLEDSIELIKGYQKLGIQNIIMTPHVMYDLYPNTRSIILKALQLLEEEILKTGITDVKIKTAAEYMIDSNFDSIVRKRELLTLKDNYVLVEMSYLQPPIHLESSIELMFEYGYQPVLAHPERYHFFHNRIHKIQSLKNKGCKLQMNLLSLSGYYGQQTQQTIIKLIELGLIDFAGTDTHNSIHQNKLSSVIIPRKHLTEIHQIIKNTNSEFANF